MASKISPRFDRDLASAIGFRVTGRRRHLGLSQRELGAACGITNSCVSYIELGMHMPGPSAVIGLCRVLGLTPNQLLGWEED